MGAEVWGGYKKGSPESLKPWGSTSASVGLRGTGQGGLGGPEGAGKDGGGGVSCTRHSLKCSAHAEQHVPGKRLAKVGFMTIAVRLRQSHVHTPCCGWAAEVRWSHSVAKSTM